MVDDYSGYKALFGKDITELACMAHIRRKFFDLQTSHSHAGAEEALREIAELYELEIKGKALDWNARQALREKVALPKLQGLYAWLEQHRYQAAPGSGWARSLEYALKRWLAVQRYAQSGHLSIDNNPIENAIRPIALGRKNWLFAGSERAGKRAAAIQSLFATAKLNNR